MDENSLMESHCQRHYWSYCYSASPSSEKNLVKTTEAFRDPKPNRMYAAVVTMLHSDTNMIIKYQHMFLPK